MTEQAPPQAEKKELTHTELQKAKAKKTKDCFLRVFNTTDGKEVLEYLKIFCYDHQSTIDGNVIFLAAHEGRRSVLKQIQNILNWDIDAQFQQAEHQNVLNVKSEPLI